MDRLKELLAEEPEINQPVNQENMETNDDEFEFVEVVSYSIE